MARRGKSSSEGAFGSDSFLDIVANIVGILIILIVVVGVKIKNTPVPKKKPADVQQWKQQAQEIELENKKREHQRQQELENRQQEIERRLALEEKNAKQHRQHQKKLAERDRQITQRQWQIDRLTQQAALIRDDIASLTKQLTQYQEKKNQVDSKSQQQKQQIAVMQQHVQTLEKKLADRQQASAHVDVDFQQLAKKVETLFDQMKTLKNRKPTSKKLWHLGNPLARKTEQKELHFRVLNQKAAYTYFSEMLERMKNQASSQHLEGRSEVVGTIGPRGGFTMTYRYERSLGRSANVVTLMGMRFDLDKAVLSTTSDKLGESADELFLPESKLHRLLQTRGPKEHAVTLWVYPDSFELAKSLQIYLHRQGYAVAMRPMKMGDQIGASKNGRRSYAQ